MTYEFKPWPKIPRLSKMTCSVTEKLDGTNAIISITNQYDPIGLALQDGAVAVVGDKAVFAGSRSRWLQPLPKADNFGFAQWVVDNAPKLVELLGDGTHYGEWWGQGVQRQYGLTKKYFTLFNPWRYGKGLNPEIPTAAEQIAQDKLLGCVPILSLNQYSPTVIEAALAQLATGSVAVPGWAKPEGIVVHIDGSSYKVVINGDENKREG